MCFVWILLLIKVKNCADLRTTMPDCSQEMEERRKELPVGSLSHNEDLPAPPPMFQSVIFWPTEVI